MTRQPQNKLAEIEFARRNYAPETAEESYESLEQSRMRHLRLFGLENMRGLTVLDCGCGEGKDAVVLSKRGNEVIGTDISFVAATKARLLARRYDVSFSVIVSDSEHLPFRQHSFKICYCFWTLHHFPSLEKVFGELKRIIIPSGSLFILEPNGSNSVLRLSEKLEDIVRPVLSKIGADTPNEKIHGLLEYVGIIKSKGFHNISTKQWYGGNQPPLGRGSVGLRYLVTLRRGLLAFGWKYFPESTKGTDVAISASS